MTSIFTYTTPENFAKTFKMFYADTNIKQIKLLSLILFIITVITELLGFIYQDKIITIKAYDQLHSLNYIKLIGTVIFFLLSFIVLKTKNCSYRNKNYLTTAFILFLLLTSLSTSYIVSSYNTKNTLTIFLIGVVTVSLFFVIEYKQIIAIATFISIVFLLSIVIPKISFEDKLLNAIVGLVIGIFLVSLSRYNYFYKSQNFIKIKELEEKNIEIERLNIEKNDILNFVAHDLRNPLNNIEALSELMLLDGKNYSETKLIANAVKQAKDIINDLLDGVKSDPNYSQKTKINLSESLKNIQQKWATNSKREIKFTNHSLEVLVKMNPSKFERVLDNLISNGIKFSNNEQPISIDLSKTVNKARIIIQDFGIGIPKDLQKNIYDQFSISGRAGLLGEKSTGLGLHISKKIIEEEQGELLMISEENKGTSFEIILPLA